VKEKFPGLNDKLGEEHVHFVDAINNNFVHPEIEQNNEIKNVAVSSSELDTEGKSSFAYTFNQTTNANFCPNSRSMSSVSVVSIERSR
jgi:hypothetical protein